MDESGGQIHTKRRRRCRRKSFKDAKNNSGPSGTRENGTLLPAYATGASAPYISECSITMHHTGEEIQRECASLELGDWRALFPGHEVKPETARKKRRREDFEGRWKIYKLRTTMMARGVLLIRHYS
jgi:hypothetical protein